MAPKALRWTADWKDGVFPSCRGGAEGAMAPKALRWAAVRQDRVLFHPVATLS